MRGMYDIKTLSTVSGVSIFGRILESFSLVMVILLIIFVAGYAIVAHSLFPASNVSEFVVLFIVFIGIFSLLCLLCLAWMAYLALKPLRHLIQWAKNATDFKKLQVSSKDTIEVAEVTGVMNELLERLETMHQSLVLAEALVLREKDKALLQISEQVAHDIRAPLLALGMIQNELASLPEATRIHFREAITRIKDISNSLLDFNRNSELPQGVDCLSVAPSMGSLSTCLVSSLVDQLVSEKKIQYRERSDLEILFALKPESYGLFGKLSPGQFKRILSNVIDNAVESMDTSGQILLSLKENQSTIEVRCTDHGKGIAPDLLTQLGTRKVSYGKKRGHGIGLFSAIQLLNQWGGSLSLQSRLGEGTTVLIALAKGEAPSWFVPVLEIARGSKVAVVDDDLPIHQIWVQKIRNGQSSSNLIEMVHFCCLSDLEYWIKNEPGALDTLFLIDDDFYTEDEMGLEFVQRMQLIPHSILVTSRFESQEIQQICSNTGLRLISKELVPFLPVHFI